MAATLTVTPASATSAACDTAWGSQVKSNVGGSGAPITKVRAGRNDCYDRLVVDVRAPGSSHFYVRYVPEVHHDPSGQPVPLRGGAFLSVNVSSPIYDPNDPGGELTYDPPNSAELVDLTGYTTFRQAALAGSWEGTTQIGLGVRAQLPFRVFTLANPDGSTKFVIDVAHSQ